MGKANHPRRKRRGFQPEDYMKRQDPKLFDYTTVFDMDQAFE
jgi:hypothetical protein